MTLTTEDEKALMSKVPCALAMNSLMYVMICTRLEIAQAVIVVIRHMINLGRSTREL